MSAGRTLTVAGERLPRWVDGFGQRHGDVRATATQGGLMLEAADGAMADVVVPFAPWPGSAGSAPESSPAGLGDLVTALHNYVVAPRRVAVILVRRGGYACAVIDGDRIVASKVGTRYVQGRTAAGGWSQQRFARRREKQTDELAGATVDTAVRILLGGPAAQALVTGGDRPLVDRVLSQPRLKQIAALPRGPHLAIGDPRADVVRAVPGMLRAVVIHLHEPALS